MHTHVSTQNNLYLNELVPENVLWLHTSAADRLGIKDNQLVEISSAQATSKIKAKLTDFIHPEMVFMLHGFGKQVKAQSRSYQKGAADGMLQANLSDQIGGSPAFDQNLVEVRPI